MANEALTIWGVGTTRTFRAHWMAHELGLDYETRRIESRTGETAASDYTLLNPKQKVPCLVHSLVHGRLVVTESFAIMRYLRSLSDALPYCPYQTSVAGQARYDEWASFMLMELDATSLYVVRRHKDLSHIYGEAPAAVESSVEYFLRMLNAVAKDIKPDAPVWGQEFSELDIVMTVALDWAAHLSLSVPAHLTDYRNMMRARPACQAARDHNYRDLQLPVAPLK